MTPGESQADVGLKSYRRGTHRIVSPQETLERVRPFMSALGITRIANVTGLDRLGIPVVMVCRPNSRSIAVSQGKGLDLDSAKASGLMESVETYHAERITLPLKLATLEELAASHSVVDVTKLPRSRQGRYQDHEPMLWIEGYDWIDGSSLWLPYELVSANYTLPLAPGSGRFAANTNGLASGNHLLEAICHGMCEVIERDATTLWTLQGVSMRRATGLELDSVDDAACRTVLEKLEQAEVDVKVWEATSDIGVAVFYCLITARQEDGSDPESGAGCHPSREVALFRALSEAAQARTTYIAGSRDDFVPELYTIANRERRRHQCRTLMTSHVPARKFHDVPTWQSNTIREDVDWVARGLRSAGFEQIAVVDLTKDEFQLPVVRVVIPGLEGPYEGGHGDYVPGARANALLRHWS